MCVCVFLLLNPSITGYSHTEVDSYITCHAVGFTLVYPTLGALQTTVCSHDEQYNNNTKCRYSSTNDRSLPRLYKHYKSTLSD